MTECCNGTQSQTVALPIVLESSNHKESGQEYGPIKMSAPYEGNSMAHSSNLHHHHQPQQRKQQHITFRDWYTHSYCNEAHISYILFIQRCCQPLQRLITIYFRIWSITGEAEFYVIFMPTLFWLGMMNEGTDLCLLLCMSQYLTGVLKDAAGCPRPPHPPVECRGRSSTSKEYGYPSTHSSHSVVFAYMLYEVLTRLFPGNFFLCWLASVGFALNVSVSRLFLGMHWPADVISGWGVAVWIVTGHRGFLAAWKASVLTMEHVQGWHYLIAFAVMHVFAVCHAAPADPCPCYLDSLRFLGAALGTLCGAWLFGSQYDGSLSARPMHTDVLNVIFTYSFLKQTLVCLVVCILAKEISSLLASRVLRFFFMMVSTRASERLPRPMRGVWNFFSHLVRCAYGIPRRHEGGKAMVNHCPPSNAARPLPLHSPLTFMTGSHAGENACCVREDVFVKDTTNLSFMHLWSPRTHGHWWLWEAHARTVSYFTLGFFVCYVAQVILREVFGVK